MNLDRILIKMYANDMSNLLISDPVSIHYLTGYHTHPGERLLLLNIASDGNHQLYVNQLFPLARVDAAIEIITYKDGEPVIQWLSERLLPGKTGIDKFWPSHFLIELMQQHKDLTPVQGSFIIDDLRSIKSEAEQTLMKKASQLNDEAMQQLIDLVQYGLSEQAMVQQLAQIYQSLGCDGFSFEPIIAYGKNAADPHHETNHDKPQRGEAVVLDIGTRYEGYCSDMTRTIFYGEPDEESLHIYQLVKAANEAAIAQVKPGVSFAEIDRAARDIIEKAGYGQYFTHRTGHFIGREVHEAGDVSAFNHELAQVGQIFSIEPGIYLPNKIGVRIEDLVLVTEDGCEVLNHVSKDPIIIPLSV
ncbi:MAG: aminopeptidase P family protein [Aerococcaceae bacterium]|nr:aminopeptidase P family protein [Aerococcaceae bacterium]